MCHLLQNTFLGEKSEEKRLNLSWDWQKRGTQEQCGCAEQSSFSPCDAPNHCPEPVTHPDSDHPVQKGNSKNKSVMRAAESQNALLPDF